MQPAQRTRNTFFGQYVKALLNRGTIRHLYRVSGGSTRMAQASCVDLAQQPPAGGQLG
jgi:hypothetical protein